MRMQRLNCYSVRHFWKKSTISRRNICVEKFPRQHITYARETKKCERSIIVVPHNIWYLNINISRLRISSWRQSEEYSPIFTDKYSVGWIDGSGFRWRTFALSRQKRKKNWTRRGGRDQSGGPKLTNKSLDCWEEELKEESRDLGSVGWKKKGEMQLVV